MNKERPYLERRRSPISRFFGTSLWLFIELFFWVGLILAQLIRNKPRRLRVIHWLDGVDLFAFTCWDDGLTEAIKDRRRGGL